VGNTDSIWIRRTYSDYGGAGLVGGFASGRGSGAIDDCGV